MAPTAMTVCDMLDTSRKKDRIEKAQKAMDRIASIIGEDKGWDSEEEMLEDMAKFRSSQIKGVNQNGE